MSLKRQKSTAKSADKRWAKFHRFWGQRGRPKKVPDTLNQSIALAVSGNLRLLVRAAAAVSAIPVSRESIRTLRHELGSHFHGSKPWRIEFER
jgi:hypothetical protein